jgi:hypothetical protein
VVVAQRLGDDGGWDLQHELAQRGGPAGQGGDAEVTDELAEVAGVQRLAGPASGEQPAGRRVGGGVQVVALVARSSRVANGSGTGAAGSPNRMKTCPSARVTSSMVSRTMRVAGWANSSIRQAATRERSGRSWSVRSWPSSSSRRCWVIGAARRTGSGGSLRLGRRPARTAQRRNARKVRRWWSLWVACQASRSAWVAWARAWPRAASQPRNAVAWVSWSLANWRWLGVRGRAWALARSRGS